MALRGVAGWVGVSLIAVAAGCAEPSADGDPASGTCDDPAGAAAAACSEPAENEIVAARPLFDDPQGDPARWPIVLAHGFNASTTNGWSFNGVAQALRADGHFVVMAEVEPFNGVPARAATLARAIDDARRAFCAERAGGEPLDACVARTFVNVVAHSMGGLDARYAISTLGYGDRVASLTTIASPHRGSAVADAVLGLLPDASDSEVNRVLDALAAAWGRTFTRDDLASDTDLRAAFESLAERNADAFNRANPDDPRVFYQSWAGVSRPGGGLRTPSALASVQRACGGADLVIGGGTRADFMDLSLVPGAVFVAHGTAFLPADGMVTVASAKWGEFRGCLPTDHLDEVGQPASSHQGASRWTGFDHLRFYRTVAFDLAARGF